MGIICKILGHNYKPNGTSKVEWDLREAYKKPINGIIYPFRPIKKPYTLFLYKCERCDKVVGFEKYRPKKVNRYD